jgi:hypothetical protein
MEADAGTAEAPIYGLLDARNNLLGNIHYRCRRWGDFLLPFPLPSFSLE